MLWTFLWLFSSSASATTTINEQFIPATVNPGDNSVYRLTIANSSTITLTEAKVTVLFPSQITVNNPVGINQSCGFSVVQAAAGTSLLELNGGTVPAGTGTLDGVCTFELNVVAGESGNHIATIPANTVPDAATAGYTAKENGVDVFNTTPASATLSVNALQDPSGAKTFSPSSGIAGDPITTTIALNNPNAGATLPLTAFTDNLPAGMSVADPASASVACTGAGAVNGSVDAVPGNA
ncbi:MAG: DUF7933 domain-containing protein, partial [Gammaproteobacteria bacterium]